MSLSRASQVPASVASLVVSFAAVAGCTAGGTPRAVPAPAPATAPAATSMATTSRVVLPAPVEPVVATGPTDQARIAVARRAVLRLGTVNPRLSAPVAGAPIVSGSAALLGRDGDGFLDPTVTSGAWTVQVACTGSGGVTAYAAAPSVLAHLDVGTDSTPDTRGTARTVVPCGTVVAFDTARPGPDGLELRIDSEAGSPLTGVAYRLAPAG